MHPAMWLLVFDLFLIRRSLNLFFKRKRAWNGLLEVQLKMYRLFARGNKDEEDGQTVWEHTGCKHVSWHEAPLLLGGVWKVLHDCSFLSVITEIIERPPAVHAFWNYSSSFISQWLSQPILSDHAACQERVSLRVCTVWVECCAMLLSVVRV